jgi:ribosomal protein L24E
MSSRAGGIISRYFLTVIADYIGKFLYFCSLKANKIMAMAINSSPELWGDAARQFIEEAERNGKLPTPVISPEREKEISDFLRRSHDFILPPQQ